MRCQARRYGGEDDRHVGSRAQGAPLLHWQVATAYEIVIDVSICGGLDVPVGQSLVGVPDESHSEDLADEIGGPVDKTQDTLASLGYPCYDESHFPYFAYLETIAIARAENLLEYRHLHNPLIDIL